MFRHEHRYFKQLHRHFYTPQLFVLESLYSQSGNKRRFIETYKPVTRRLQVFNDVQAVYEAEQAHLSEPVGEDLLSEADMSEIEMSLELINSASSFNAAMDKSVNSDSK